ncbi:unnamed protein product [Amoebophrya sp. A25]|nr:unnamed protein product [Amoebophrya sp. A25]|eukprot:GSA25T00009591001.1
MRGQGSEGTGAEGPSEREQSLRMEASAAKARFLSRMQARQRSTATGASISASSGDAEQGHVAALVENERTRSRLLARGGGSTSGDVVRDRESMTQQELLRNSNGTNSGTTTRSQILTSMKSNLSPRRIDSY